MDSGFPLSSFTVGAIADKLYSEQIYLWLKHVTDCFWHCEIILIVVFGVTYCKP